MRYETQPTDFNCSDLYRPIVALTVGHSAFADGPSTAATGINSQGLGLTGSGIAIGQVGSGRPGQAANPPGDNAANTHPNVKPAGVFLQNGPAIVNANTSNHAERVAGVMISTHGTHKSVASGASLYSSVFTVPANIINSNPSISDPARVAFEQNIAVSAQHIAQQNGGDVRAINFSFGTPPVSTNTLDGNSLLTQFVDWSAAEHDVLYVVAGNEGAGGIPIPLPTDNFNGLTVAFSKKNGTKFRQVDSDNLFTEDAVGDRTSIDLIAPGRDITLPTLTDANLPDKHVVRSGTSYAAPHVTGTVALLQEYGDGRIAANAPNWGGTVASGATAHRHEVMKVVLMNSADKLIDNNTVTVPGGIPIPTGGLLAWNAPY